MKKLLAALTVAMFALQGCGSSNESSVNTQSQKKDPQAITTDEASDNQSDERSVDVSAEVAAEVSEYIEQFKHRRDQLVLVFDGSQYPIEFVANNDKQMSIGFELGIAVIGFDFDQQEPIASLVLALDATTNEPPSFLISNQIEITEDDQENLVYSGTVVEQNSGAMYLVKLTFNEALLYGGTSKVKIEQDKAILKGSLGANTYIQMQQLITHHPEVTTLVLKDVEGSVDDYINMHTGRLIRAAQLTTQIPFNGEAYSGGVDLFTAGVRRIVEPRGIVGVHSWCCHNGKAANELSKDDPAHAAQVAYFREMLGDELGPQFYFFTINAANADEIHEMSEAQLTKYKLTTE